MSYADADIVRAAAEKMETGGTVNETELSEAILTADFMVDSELDETTLPSTTPNAIILAANLFAKAAYLDSTTKRKENRSPTAVEWDKKAKIIIAGYVKGHPGSDDNSPYHVHRSPRDNLTRRGHSTPEEEDRRFRKALDWDEGW